MTITEADYETRADVERRLEMLQEKRAALTRQPISGEMALEIQRLDRDIATCQREVSRTRSVSRSR